MPVRSTSQAHQAWGGAASVNLLVQAAVTLHHPINGACLDAALRVWPLASAGQELLQPPPSPPYASSLFCFAVPSEMFYLFQAQRIVSLQGEDVVSPPGIEQFVMSIPVSDGPRPHPADMRWLKWQVVD